MKTPRERAIEIAYEAVGKSFSREFFRLLLDDTGEGGEQARKLVAVIERGIEKDRAEVERARGPS